MNEIKVFGEKAKQIQKGDIFIASVGYVDGRTVVTLIPKVIKKEMALN